MLCASGTYLLFCDVRRILGFVMSLLQSLRPDFYKSVDSSSAHHPRPPTPGNHGGISSHSESQGSGIALSRKINSLVIFPRKFWIFFIRKVENFEALESNSRVAPLCQLSLFLLFLLLLLFVCLLLALKVSNSVCTGAIIGDGDRN